MGAIGNVGIVFVLVLALYCGVDPLKQSAIYGFDEFESHKVEMPSWELIPRARDHRNLLQKSEIINDVQGPESVAFDPLGRGPYTGVADGRILFWDGLQWNPFAYTSSNWTEVCKPEPTSMTYLPNEHICGRPLGLRFNNKTGELYIADAYLGLLKVGPEGGLATSLVTEAEGEPLMFTNDLDIDDQGNIYFTDSSTKYQRRNFMQLGFSCESSGRLLKYNPQTKETTVLMRNIQYPNGVSLSKDGSFLVYSEGCLGRLSRYWVKGERAGSSEVFAILPGYPDNVRTNEEGEFWVALHYRRTMYCKILGLYPKLRTFILKLPIPSNIQYLIQVGGRVHAVAVKYSPEGKLLQVLEDSHGKVVKAISEVHEKDGKLWIGSVLMPFVAVYNLEA